jgi:hypothetical protein
VVGLTSHRRFPVEPQPGQVVVDCGLEFGAAAGAVDVLDAQQATAAGVTGGFIGSEGGKGVAPVTNSATGGL